MRLKNILVIFLLGSHFLNTGCNNQESIKMNQNEFKKIEKTDKEWRELLSDDEYYVTRLQGTEPAFSGQYWNHKDVGVYKCTCCGAELFLSDAKFDSGCGWPSYFKPIQPGIIAEKKDLSHGMVRTEVRCSACDAHLGHVFPDGPPPTGLRYCINSLAIKFEKAP